MRTRESDGFRRGLRVALGKDDDVDQDVAAHPEAEVDAPGDDRPEADDGSSVIGDVEEAEEAMDAYVQAASRADGFELDFSKRPRPAAQSG